MTTWTRVAFDTRCGRCGGLLEAGDPVQVYRLAGVRRPLLRGACCADGPFPHGLPERPPRLAPVPGAHLAPVRLALPGRRPRAGAVDWRARQTKDD